MTSDFLSIFLSARDLSCVDILVWTCIFYMLMSLTIEYPPMKINCLLFMVRLEENKN